MYCLKRYLTMRNAALRNAWLEMEREGNISPFLYFDYVREIFRQTAWLNPAYIPMIYCLVNEQGEICAIAPMKLNVGKRRWKLLGDIQGSGEAGWLVRRDASEEEKRLMVGQLLAHFGKRKMQMRRVLTPSTLSAQLEDKGGWRCVMPTECVRIDFGDDIDAHLKGLKSSVRQNIRTAYNRLNRDNKQYSLQIFDHQTIDQATWDEMMDIYLKRLFDKYKQKKANNALKKRERYFFYRHFKHDTRSLRLLSNTWHAVLRIDGQLAAFMSGFVNHSGTEIVIPRLAIDATFSFYSPGYILICEALRTLADKTQVRTLGLSRGEEKYKYDLGGTAYQTLDFEP